MKRLILLLICSFFLFGSAIADEGDLQFSSKVEQMAYRPFYWVLGTVQNAEDGTSADGKTIVFYKDETDEGYNQFNVNTKIVNNKFIMNAFLASLDLEVGNTYRLVVVAGDDGYGAGPIDVTISGLGYEEIDLVLEYGKGKEDPPTGGVSDEVIFEPPPYIKYKFGNRIYQKGLIAKWKEQGKSFVVSATPKLKINVGIDQPFALSANIADYKLILDPGTENKEYSLSAQNMTQKVKTAGTERVEAFALNYTVSEPLDQGEHIFKVVAKSSGLDGVQATATEYATVEVIGGPLRLIGDPLVYPSPFSKPKDDELTIQYTLSTDGDIDIYIIDVGGRRLKKFALSSGEEGGSAGINKVVWDASTAFGGHLANGIYVGTIVAKQEGRLLGKLKLTVVN